ncbi:hypothetical protein N0V88_006729 [Collariella sp. IMI 366227]|nr:hypothetical protein N0V88_006729 [Collariella sp. IMI 366227]
MGRALRVAQLAATAARCAPASSALASPRVWQLAGNQRAPALRLAAQMRLGGSSAPARYNHTSAGEAAAEEKTVVEETVVSKTVVLEETPVPIEQPVAEQEPIPQDEAMSEEELPLEEPASEDSMEYMERMAMMIERMEVLEARLAETVKKQNPRKRWSESPFGIVNWEKAPLTLHLKGRNTPVKADPLWLRDSCTCKTCVDPHSGQKTFATTELADIPQVDDARFLPNGDLRVTFGNDQHVCHFPKSEVDQWNVDPNYWRGRAATKRPWPIHWDRIGYAKMIASGKCDINYRDWMENDEAFWDAFSDLCQTGLIFVRGVPEDEESVRRIAERIGQLQHTFYGWTWDVKSKPQAENVAYTSGFLGLHQDLMYHDPIPQLQLLHCLSNSCKGGESLFSNGIRAAYEMEYQDAESYKVLTSYKVPFGYNKNGNHYWASRRTITTAPDGAPLETRWAPPFQVPSRQASDPFAHQAFLQWKRASLEFQKIVESRRSTYLVKMNPGDCVIFNNSTVLHGRREFQTAEGSRWLKGAYIAPQTYLGAISRLEAVREAQGNPLPSIFRGAWR